MGLLFDTQQTLNSWGYSTDPEALEEELHDVANELATCRDESAELDRLREQISPWLLAEMALEVASYLPDDAKTQASMPRACWRHLVISTAERCIQECNITAETDDIDEVFVNWIAKEEALS